MNEIKGDNFSELISGVDKIEVDAGKGTLTVTGNADPYEIIVGTRKVAKFVEVESIGPPPAPPTKDSQKKQDDKKPDQKTQIHNPHTCPCPLCNPMTTVVHVDHYPQSPVSCSIL